MYVRITSLAAILFSDKELIDCNVLPATDKIPVICFVSSSVNDAVPDASTKYAPFLAQINKGSVGQFADGFTPSKSDIKRGYKMEQTRKDGRVQYRNVSTGKYV
jgi:hypothetical protein